jgi:hypothetical protein
MHDLTICFNEFSPLENILLSAIHLQILLKALIFVYFLLFFSGIAQTDVNSNLDMKIFLSRHH